MGMWKMKKMEESGGCVGMEEWANEGRIDHRFSNLAQKARICNTDMLEESSRLSNTILNLVQRRQCHDI